MFNVAFESAGTFNVSFAGQQNLFIADFKEIMQAPDPGAITVTDDGNGNLYVDSTATVVDNGNGNLSVIE